MLSWNDLRYYTPWNKPQLWRRPFTFLTRKTTCALMARFAPEALRRPRVVSLLCADARMQVEPNELIGRTIYYSGVFEYPVSLFIRRGLSTGDSFVDVGANLGYHSLLAACSVGPTGEVWACEPVERLRSSVTRNAELNGFTNIHVVDAAVCDRSGSVDFYESANPANSGLSSIQSRAGSLPARQVRATTLDELAKHARRLALVKVDVEGAELEVFRGAVETIASPNAPCFVFECYDLTPVLELLARNGYETRKLSYGAGRLTFPPVDSDRWSPFHYDAPTYVAMKPSWKGRGFSYFE